MTIDRHPAEGKPALSVALGLLLAVHSGLIQARRHRSGTDEAQILAQCPPGGDARSERVRELNILKRRMTAPTPAEIDPTVTLKEMLAPGNDTDRWNQRKGATVSGYVADVKVGGIESVNCHTHSPKYRDTHIDLTLTPMNESESKHVIVEVTPQWREKVAKEGVDWSTRTLRRELLGRWIRVTGWLFLDEEHANASENWA